MGSEDYNNAYYSVAPFFAAGLLTISIFWIVLIYRLYCVTYEFVNYDLIYNFYRTTATALFTFFLFCAMADVVHLYFCWVNDYTMLGGEYNIIKAFADLFFFFGSALLNITLFGRVYFTFKHHSHLSLSWYTILFITTQIITSIILGLLYCMLLLLISKNHEELADQYSKPLVVAIDINDLTVSVSMLFLFSYKLHQLVVGTGCFSNTKQRDNFKKFKEASTATATRYSQYSTDAFSTVTRLNNTSLLTPPPRNTNAQSLTAAQSVNTAHHSMNSDICNFSLNTTNTTTISMATNRAGREKSVTLDQNQLHTIVVITRYAILGGFAVFFNQIYYGVGYYSMNESWEHSYYDGLLVYALRMLGMIGIIVSIYFSMAFAKPMYFYCCAGCHFACYQCCIKFTRRRLKLQKG